jgi:hypothetical protein
MRSTFRRGALALAAASFLSIWPTSTALADGPEGGQDPPEGGRPSSLCGPGCLEWDPLLQACVLITQVAVL